MINTIENLHQLGAVRTWRAFVEQLQLRNARAGEVIQHNSGFGIPVRTVSQYKIMHDKVIIADGRNIEVGSFNYTRAADRVNSENVLVVWDVPVVAQRYLQHWQTRWEMGKDWSSSY